jgi:hypothetical protein
VETEHLFELLAGDARGIGYVLKERVAGIAQFTGAIRRVAAGESVIVRRWWRGWWPGRGRTARCRR